MTRNEKRFVQEYLIDLNGVKAYQRSFPREKTYESACAKASALLKREDVRAEIEEAQTRLMAELGITQKKVLSHWAAIAFSDIRSVFDKDGCTLKDLTKLEDHTAIAIASVQVDETWTGTGSNKLQSGFTRKVKFWDKVEALKRLEAHLGIDKPQKVDLSGAIRVIRDNIA